MRFQIRWPRFRRETMTDAAPAVEPPPAPLSPPGELDMRALSSALMRRRNWIVIPTLAVAVLSFVAVNMVTPRYKSEARILVDGRENAFLRPTGERAEERTALDAEAVASQVQLVLSRDLAREVIKKNKLGERPEFDPVLEGVSPLRSLLALFGIGRDPFRLTPEERVMDAYYERLTAFAVDKSRVISVEFQSRDPELAARVANSIAEGYMALQQAAKQEQARSAGQWLSGEIDNLRKKVSEAESRVEEFRSKASLFTGTNNTSLSNQQMGEINTQLNNARALKADAESKSRLIREMLQGGRPIESSDILNSELVRRLNEQRVTLRAQLAEQSSTLLGGHPRIKELRAQISDLDRQIREEAVRISRSLDNDARIAGARVESLGASLDQLKKQASATNGQDVQLRALEREAKAQRDLLESYLAKYREATARESIETAPSDGRIISRAIVTNTPAFPKKLPIVLISTLATLLLTTGVVVMGELMRMTAPAGAAEQLAPIDAPRVTVREKAAALKSNLATPPEVAPEREAFVVEPDSEEASETPPIVVSEPTPESFGELEKVAKQLRNAGEGARKITVMGTSEPDATSRTALALARLLSRNSSVILIDLTLASPAIAAVSSDPDGPGLSDLVLGGASFGAIISRDLNSRVQLIGGGTMQADISILQSPRLMMAVDALTRVYDHVVLDAGTLDDVPEALASANAQAVLVAGGTLDDRTRTIIQDELLSAGFRGVSILSEPATAAGEKEPRMAAA